MKSTSSQSVRIKHIPQRTCLACRQVKAKRELIRLVHTSDGNIEIDDNWCALYGDKADSNAPSKNVIVGLFTDSAYAVGDDSVQWEYQLSNSFMFWVINHQTRFGGVFFVPYDVDDLPSVPFSNGADYPVDLAHQPFKNTVPQRAWRIRKDTAYQLG